MKIKTADLQGDALDWAVATLEGYTDWCGKTEKFLPPRKEYGWVDFFDLRYSTDWSQAGPIIERERISLYPTHGVSWFAEGAPDSECDQELAAQRGPTPLIAAMRCFVAFKLGDEVEIPEELANP